MSVLTALRSLFNPDPATSLARYYDAESLLFQGQQYALTNLNQSLGGRIEDIDVGYTSLAMRAYYGNPVVFACMRARRDLFTEARFGFQNMRGGVPGDFYGDRNQPNSKLALLDHPWPGATTGDLLKYMILDNDLAGNAFVARVNGTLKRLRPDWVRIVHGSPNPDGTMWDADAVLLGYAYQPGGPGHDWVKYLPEEIAHFSTTPDPLQPTRGMSWLSPVVREVMADEAMTVHRLKYHEHGGTPNLVIKTGFTETAKLHEFMEYIRQNHEGTRNAYKMMGFTQGIDATVIGKDLQQNDFKVVQGAGETRIAAAAGVPPIIAGLSEGLQGSSLNAGQGFAASMRMFADLTMSPAWRNAAGSLEMIVRPPTGARLWYDIRGIPALKDDILAAADVRAKDASAMRQLTDAGWIPESVQSAFISNDWKLLKFNADFTSVQLQAINKPAPQPVPQLVAAPPKRTEELIAASEERTWERTRELVALTRQPNTVTIAEGAVQVSNPVTITTPDVRIEAPVTVTTPDVHVTTPDVHVTVPERSVTVAPAEVNVTTPEVTVMSPVQPAMRTIVDRDDTGRVTGTHEEPLDVA